MSDTAPEQTNHTAGNAGAPDQTVERELPSSQSLIESAGATDTRYVDDSGFHIGQTFDHDGFDVEVRLSEEGGAPHLVYVATEKEISQKAHQRQARYTQTFTSADAAKTAISSSADSYHPKASNDAPAQKRSRGFSDDQMIAAGWRRLGA